MQHPQARAFPKITGHQVIPTQVIHTQMTLLRKSLLERIGMLFPRRSFAAWTLTNQNCDHTIFEKLDLKTETVTKQFLMRSWTWQPKLWPNNFWWEAQLHDKNCEWTILRTWPLTTGTVIEQFWIWDKLNCVKHWHFFFSFVFSGGSWAWNYFYLIFKKLTWGDLSQFYYIFQNSRDYIRLFNFWKIHFYD